MFGPIINMLFVVAALVCAAPVIGQTDQHIVRLDLKDNSHNGPPDTLPVYVEISTIQPSVEQGIVFTLHIENNGDTTIRIRDPIDTTSISLRSRTQPPSKNLQNLQPDFLVCGIRGVSAERRKKMSDAKNAKRPFQAFDAYEASRYPRLKTVTDIVPWEPTKLRPVGSHDKTAQQTNSDNFEGPAIGTITLEPGERFQAVLRITRVHSNYETYKKAYEEWINDYCIPTEQGSCVPAAYAPPRPEPKIIPIPYGKYSLGVWVLLFTDNCGDYAASFDKRVIIQLGEPTNPEQKDTVRP